MKPKRTRAGRPWPCQRAADPCACQCHAIAEARATATRRTAHGDEWLPEHDAILRARLLAGATVDEIIDAIDRAHKIRRSPDAVRARVAELGESLRTGWRSQNEAAAALGVHPKAIGTWRAAGLLVATRHGGSHWLRIQDADLDAFVRAQAGRILDPTRITDRHLRSLAEVSARANRERSA